MRLIDYDLAAPLPPTQGGIAVSIRRAELVDLAEEVDRLARSAHEAIAYELDSLGALVP